MISKSKLSLSSFWNPASEFYTGNTGPFEFGWRCSSFKQTHSDCLAIMDLIWYGSEPYFFFFLSIFWLWHEAGMWDLSSLIRDQTCDPRLESGNPDSRLDWKLRVLISGPPGKSQILLLKPTIGNPRIPT